MTERLTLLGIDVPADLVQRWLGWIAPVRQPFLVDVGSELAKSDPVSDVTPELVDTYGFYGLPENLTVVSLDEPSFSALPRATRSALVRSQVTNRRALVPSVRAW